MTANPTDAAKIQRLVKRDVKKVLREVERLLTQCQLENICVTSGPGGKCCEADKLAEIRQKLQDFNDTLLEGGEEAKVTIRTDLIAYL